MGHNSLASYAMRNSIDHCTSLLNDVFTYFLVEMKSDGTFDEIWDLYRKRVLGTCSLEDNSSDEEDSGQFQLSLISMGGVFVFHLFLTFFSAIVEFVLLCVKPKDFKQQLKDKVITDFKEVLNNSLKKEED